VKEDYTVLLFDTKPTLREFKGFHDIPVCYQPTTDPLVLIGLLEAKRKARLNPLYATLGRICERASNIKDIIKNAKAMEKANRSGFIKDACYTLADLLKRVDDEISSIKFVDHLALKDGVINVMPINSLSEEAQQLVLKTAFHEVLRHHNRHTIVCVDEAFKFFPQDWSSACKREGMSLITQGAKTKCFVWISTQFIATTEKDVMKACSNKLLGRQDDDTEIVATQKRVPGAKKLVTRDDLMTLQPGEFFFVPLSGKSTKLKVIPYWVREGRDEPALEEEDILAPETLSDSMHDSFVEEAEDLSDRLEKLGF
jgi:hypothetical protein